MSGAFGWALRSNPATPPWRLSPRMSLSPLANQLPTPNTGGISQGSSGLGRSTPSQGSTQRIGSNKQSEGSTTTSRPDSPDSDPNPENQDGGGQGSDQDPDNQGSRASTPTTTNREAVFTTGTAPVEDLTFEEIADGRPTPIPDRLTYRWLGAPDSASRQTKVPEMINVPRPLTEDECQAMRVRQLRSGQRVYLRPSNLLSHEFGNGDVFSHVHHSHDSLPQNVRLVMNHLRETMHRKQAGSGWLTQLERMLRHGRWNEEAASGGAFMIGPVPGSGISRQVTTANTTPSNPDPTTEGDRLHREVIAMMAQLVVLVMKAFLPEEELRRVDHASRRDGGIRLGSLDNLYTNNMQIRTSPLNDGRDNQPDSGSLMADVQSDGGKYSVHITLSNVGPDIFPGRMYLGHTRDIVDLQPGGVIIYKGSVPHCFTAFGNLNTPPGTVGAAASGLPPLDTEQFHPRHLTVINRPLSDVSQGRLENLKLDDAGIEPEVIRKWQYIFNSRLNERTFSAAMTLKKMVADMRRMMPTSSALARLVDLPAALATLYLRANEDMVEYQDDDEGNAEEVAALELSLRGMLDAREADGALITQECRDRERRLEAMMPVRPTSTSSGAFAVLPNTWSPAIEVQGGEAGNNDTDHTPADPPNSSQDAMQALTHRVTNNNRQAEQEVGGSRKRKASTRNAAGIPNRDLLLDIGEPYGLDVPRTLASVETFVQEQIPDPATGAAS